MWNKIHILWQDKKNWDIKNFLCHLAASLPALCTVYAHYASRKPPLPQKYLATIKCNILLASTRQHLKRWRSGFPGGAVVENLPANAGDAGSSPGLGRAHMPRSNWAREPQLLSLRVWSLCSATTEAAIVRGPRTAMKSGPRLPQLEKALAQKRRPNTAKNK